MTLEQKLRALADQYKRDPNLSTLRIGLLLILDEVEKKQRERPYATSYGKAGL